jgi:hypothetical protein
MRLQIDRELQNKLDKLMVYERTVAFDDGRYIEHGCDEDINSLIEVVMPFVAKLCMAGLITVNVKFKPSGCHCYAPVRVFQNGNIALDVELDSEYSIECNSVVKAINSPSELHSQLAN